MKFLLFADLHRSKGTFDGGSYEDLTFFEARAKAEGCDFIIHAGDMCHGTTHKDNGAFVQAYNALSVPTYHCLGNHDADHTSFEQVAADYRLGKGYYCIDGAHARLIVLNPNYYYENGQYVNYSEGNYFYKDRDYLPPDQLSWLEKTVEESPVPCILLSHESLERRDGVKNRQAVREIIRRANERRKNSVVMCINGHDHKDHVSVLEGVCYWSVNSASFEILGSRHDHYPKELCERLVNVNHTLVINDPICAVVTVEEGRVEVKGMESSFFLNVTKDMTQNPVLDAEGWEATARIGDFCFRW